MTALERAARALMDHWFENYDHGPAVPMKPRWESLSQSQRDYGLGQARAVLMAVRGVDGHGIEMNYWSERVVDALLNEGEPK